MTSPADTTVPPARDDEHALRMLVSDWLRDGRITSAAFHTRHPTNPRYVSVSLFVDERLPDQDGNRLHLGRFASYGRARLAVGYIRSASRVVDGVDQVIGFDLLMTGSAEPPLEQFGTAHADLRGPTHRTAAARALALAFNQHGHLEKVPG